MKRRQATLKGNDKVIGVDLVPAERDRRFEFIPKGSRYGFLGLKKTKEDLWKICHLGLFDRYLTKDELPKYMGERSYLDSNGLVYHYPYVEIHRTSGPWNGNVETHRLSTEESAETFFEEVMKDYNLEEIEYERNTD